MKIIFFIISCIGFYLYLYNKNKIKKEFLPIIIISLIAVVQYLGGIINQMRITAIIIGVTGFVLAIYEIFLILKNKKKDKIDINLIIYCSITALFIYLLKGVKLTHYDNFSHWGMIIKNMLLNNRFPTLEDRTILFTSYPPGTACFAYYVCKYLGSSEGIMLFSQSIIILSSIYAVLALCKKESKIDYIVFLGATIYLLLGNIFIDQLLVDTVLPVMGIAILGIINYYKNDSKKALLLTIPICSLLLLVKNSGIFFVIIDLIVWLIYCVKNREIKQIIKSKYITIFLIPIIITTIWKVHLKVTFGEETQSKHSVSVSNYLKNIKEKQNEDIKIVVNKFIQQMFSIKQKENIQFLLIIITFLIMWIIEKENKNKILSYFLLFLITYIIYQIFLFAMYIFSMPLTEAKQLAGYIRYYRTIILFEYGIYLVALLRESKSKNYFKKMLSIITLILNIILIILSPNKINLLYKKNMDKSFIRYKLQQIKEENSIEDNKSYIIYIAYDNNYTADYLYFICEYEFWSQDVEIIKDINQIREKVDNYDYLIIINHSEEMNQFLEKIGGQNQNAVKLK